MTNEANSQPENVWAERNWFLNAAGALEGGMAVAALGLAWVFGIDVWTITFWSWSAVWQVVLALCPMVAAFVITYRWPFGPFARIKNLLVEVMGPPLAACQWYDLLLLAALAGLGEELLFRGVIQVGLDAWAGRGVGWIVASVLFGLAHAVTLTYAIVAALIGLYLGALLYLWDPPNLLVPIVIHAVYDLIAFFILRTDYRRQQTH